MHLLFLFCFFSSWHCRNYDAMLNLINTWAPILPQWITDNIKQQLILPRLQVSSNMKSRHIHTWVCSQYRSFWQKNLWSQDRKYRCLLTLQMYSTFVHGHHWFSGSTMRSLERIDKGWTAYRCDVLLLNWFCYATIVMEWTNRDFTAEGHIAT